MEPSKKLKAEAKELGIPGYWRYSKEKLLELVSAKKPKDVPAKLAVAKTPAPAKPKAQSKLAAKPSPKPTPKDPVKPTVKAEPVASKPPAPPKDNKAEIFKRISECNELIAAERELIKGPKSVYHYSMLDRALVSLKDVTVYLGKIK